MKEIKAIIFDMDGVIFDTESLWRRVFLDANRVFDVPLTEEYRQSICGKNEAVIRQELKEMLPDMDSEGYRNFIVNGVKTAIANGNFEVKAGFDAFIHTMKQKGYQTALATASDRKRAENMFRIKGYDIETLFDARIFGDEAGERSKPDPYLFMLAAEKLGLNPESCLVLEDSINGIVAAQRGGFVPVMVLDLIPPDEFCRTHCRLIAEKLEALLLSELF